MITPQYTYDNTGNKVGVFLAIEDWNELQQVPGVDEISQNNIAIPEWQVALGEAELKNIADGTAGLTDWNDAKKHLIL